MNAAFKARLAARERIVGTWVKTPSPIIVEVLALTGLDCLVLDAEHAPFGRTELDACTQAARDMPVLIRPESAEPHHILQALDYGAAGVIVPHVRTPDEAAALVRSAHYGPNGRGYAGTTRAAGFGTKGMARTRADGAHASVIAQIEDADALPHVDAIARTPGLDALFIGRADLTLSLGAETPDDPRVVAGVQAILDAGVKAGMPVGMFLARPSDAASWAERGASLFLLESDHDFIRAGAARLAETARA